MVWASTFHERQVNDCSASSLNALARIGRGLSTQYPGHVLQFLPRKAEGPWTRRHVEGSDSVRLRRVLCEAHLVNGLRGSVLKQWTRRKQKRHLTCGGFGSTACGAGRAVAVKQHSQ